MKPQVIKPCFSVKGKIDLLGDKSIAHRAAILSAVSCGKTSIQNFPPNKDCLATINILKKLGIKIRIRTGAHSALAVDIFGKGLTGFKKPRGPLSAGDSGTTFRLVLGILAGQSFRTVLSAGKSLSKRPMLRVNAPLRMMGARINARRLSGHEEYPPVTVRGGGLRAIKYCLPVASAQVKSAILFAALYAKGSTIVIEPVKTRDHSERMLKNFGADIKVLGNKVVIKKSHGLISPHKIYIPGDISSASFFITLAAILPNSVILLKNVCLNPSRLGLISVLIRMGADIQAKGQRPKAGSFEPVGDLIAKSSKLKGVTVKANEIPSLIDELPILMVAACYAKGNTVLEGVSELRAKETDRIKSMIENLTKMGAKIRVFKAKKTEKILISGVNKLKGASTRSFGDHRTAMSMLIAGLTAEGNTRVDDIDCINKSFPNFMASLKAVLR